MDIHVIKIGLLLSQQLYKPTELLGFMLDFALRELFNNAVEHGNGNHFEKKVNYNLTYSSSEFEIEILDEGNGFDLEAIITMENDSDVLRDRNRGLFVVHQLGFMLHSAKGSIKAKLELNDNLVFCEGSNEPMLIQMMGDKVILQIKTNITVTNVKNLVEKLKKELDHKEDYAVLEFDLSQVSGIDSMGITFLIGVYKTLKSKGKKVILSGVTDAMLQLFKIMKLDEIFEIERI